MKRIKEVAIIADQYQQKYPHKLKNQHTILTALQACQTVLPFLISWTLLPVLTSSGLWKINQDRDHVLTTQHKEQEASPL
jgi:hypothetical protein